VPDLAAPDRPFRPGPRVKGVAAHPGVFEMTWDNDGRATFSYGDERVPGRPHVIWRRIGTHAIFTPPPGPLDTSAVPSRANLTPLICEANEIPGEPNGEPTEIDTGRHWATSSDGWSS
jgi:hypothetical protein